MLVNTEYLIPSSPCETSHWIIDILLEQRLIVAQPPPAPPNMAHLQIVSEVRTLQD